MKYQRLHSVCPKGWQTSRKAGIVAGFRLQYFWPESRCDKVWCMEKKIL